jgi:hypothetical protein
MHDPPLDYSAAEWLETARLPVAMLMTQNTA